MLEYDRIDISGGIDVKKTNPWKECDICHYCYFKDIGFKYEPYLCNRCHGLMQKAMNFVDVTFVFIKGSDYRIYFWYMSKDDWINIMKNSNLNEKSVSLKFFFIIYKNEWNNLVSKKQRNNVKKSKRLLSKQKRSIKRKSKK